MSMLLVLTKALKGKENKLRVIEHRPGNVNICVNIKGRKLFHIIPINTLTLIKQIRVARFCNMFIFFKFSQYKFNNLHYEILIMVTRNIRKGKNNLLPRKVFNFHFCKSQNCNDFLIILNFKF